MNPTSKDRVEIQELMVEVAVLKSRLEAADAALKLQAQEYSRRLDLLNESHSAMDKDRALYVTRELHDQLYAEMIRRISECVPKADFTPVENQVKINTEKFGEALARNDGRNAMIYAVLASAISIGGFLVALYNAIEGVK